MGMGSGGILEGSEGLVAHKALAKCLGALCTDEIALQTVNKGKLQTSWGTDSGGRRCGSVLEQGVL